MPGRRRRKTAQRSPGIQNFPARELKTGDRRLKIGFAQRFLLHSDSFASISTRLQKRFWILTNQSLRLAFAMNVHFSEGSPGGARKRLFWETGNLSTLDLEFHSSFRTILGKFRECRETPLTAWLAKGNPLGPEK